MENDFDEISLEDYDAVRDEYKIRAAREDYELESAGLLEKINERDELIKLLKIAKPGKIAEIRKLITDYDECIEESEEITAMCYSIYQRRRKLWKRVMKLLSISDAVRPELLQHIAENNPEKLEGLEAILSDEGKTH